jgi:hypothetical protein
MADYYSLMSRAVDNLDANNVETRHSLYEHARAAQLNQLRKLDPPLTESVFERERLALDEAIRKIESHARLNHLLSSQFEEQSRSSTQIPAATNEGHSTGSRKVPAFFTSAGFVVSLWNGLLDNLKTLISIRRAGDGR